MAATLQGLTAKQQRELRAMLGQLSALWAALTEAAASGDDARVATIRAEIGRCRDRVEEIKRAGTRGSA